MRVGVLADAHGNAAALAAGLTALADADRLVYCGDAAGYYPWLAETVALLRARALLAVCGNHDAYALGRVPRLDNPLLRLAVADARARLTGAVRGWLAALPARATLRAGEVNLALWHGRPDDDEAGMPESDAECAALLDAAGVPVGSIVCCGHTHRAAIRRVGGRLLVNPGSLGYPRDGEQPGVALLDTATMTATLLPVRFDRAAARQRLEREMPDGELRRMLLSRLPAEVTA